MCSVASLLPEHVNVQDIAETLHKLDRMLTNVQRESRFLTPFRIAISKLDRLVSGQPASPPAFGPLEGVMEPDQSSIA